MSFFLALVSGCISNTSTEAVNNYHYEVDTVIYLDHMEDNLFLQSNIIAHIYEAEANIDLFEFIFDVDNIVGVVMRIDYPIEGYVDYKEFYINQDYNQYSFTNRTGVGMKFISLKEIENIYFVEIEFYEFGYL